jgi:predicted RNA-binding protein Jag
MVGMSDKWIEVEGTDVAQALEKACSELGVNREDLEYEFDLNHYKGGASTARLLVGKKDPRADDLSGELDERLGRLLEAQNLDARVSVRVTLFAVQIELHAPAPGTDDEPFQAFAATLKEDLAEYLGDRDLRVSLRGFEAEERFENNRRERRGRPDNGRRRYDRGPRPSYPEDREERDEKLRERARIAITNVKDGDGPVSLEDLNSYERRLVHLVVRESEGVTSHSVGEGLRKDVMIELGDPEE